jgi:hypothetical protein
MIIVSRSSMARLFAAVPEILPERSPPRCAGSA